MKMLSLPLDEYNSDLTNKYYKGRKEGMRYFLKMLELSKGTESDKEEAVIRAGEYFEEEKELMNDMLDALDLRTFAERMWGS